MAEHLLDRRGQLVRMEQEKADLPLQAGAWAGGAAAQGGKQLGQAVRNAVKQGQVLSRGRP